MCLHPFPFEEGKWWIKGFRVSWHYSFELSTINELRHLQVIATAVKDSRGCFSHWTAVKHVPAIKRASISSHPWEISMLKNNSSLSIISAPQTLNGCFWEWSLYSWARLASQQWEHGWLRQKESSLIHVTTADLESSNTSYDSIPQQCEMTHLTRVAKFRSSKSKENINNFGSIWGPRPHFLVHALIFFRIDHSL